MSSLRLPTVMTKSLENHADIFSFHSTQGWVLVIASPALHLKIADIHTEAHESISQHGYKIAWKVNYEVREAKLFLCLIN
jgi:hypothetical protein